jgi:hypothetical protein
VLRGGCPDASGRGHQAGGPSRVSYGWRDRRRATDEDLRSESKGRSRLRPDARWESGATTPESRCALGIKGAIAPGARGVLGIGGATAPGARGVLGIGGAIAPGARGVLGIGGAIAPAARGVLGIIGVIAPGACCALGIRGVIPPESRCARSARAPSRQPRRLNDLSFDLPAILRCDRARPAPISRSCPLWIQPL